VYRSNKQVTDDHRIFQGANGQWRRGLLDDLHQEQGCRVEAVVSNLLAI
jgi:hypothetical protein